MVNLFNQLEEAFLAAEKLLGVSITLLDKTGVFHDDSGGLLLGRTRYTHQKQLVCQSGWSAACIQHCRYEVFKRFETNPEPHVHLCWKGLREIALPIFKDELLLGVVYAGIWRDSRGENSPLDHPKVPAAMKKAYKELKSEAEVPITQLIPMLEVFVRGIVDILDTSKLGELQPDSRRARIKRFIFNRASTPVTLDDLAEYLSLSPTRAGHVVKELFGAGFKDLLNKERMNRARSLLLAGDDQVALIANQVGYRDEFHFSRSFKKHFGVSPSRYRHQKHKDTY